MSSNKTENRDGFTSKFGFIISCIGAALGLGNIWMFSYKLGAYGGAAFLIPYFLFVFLLGASGLIAEFSFGRMYQRGSFIGIKETFKRKKLKGGSIIGSIPALGLAGVLVFYTIVVGWVLKYFALSVTGELTKIDTTTYFDNFAGTSSSIPWFLLAMGLTLAIVCFGISKGIEVLNKIAMPLLFILFVVLIVRSLTLPGAMEGVKFLVTPHFEYLLKAETWVMALGQAFFTLCLNGCGMVVYGSYTNDKIDFVSSSISTSIFTVLSALLAALIIIPAVFAFNLDPSAGPSLLFITIPKIFQAMPYGGLLSILFFFSIILATISSSINILEGPAEALMSGTKMGRKAASIIIAVIATLLATPLTTNMGLFDSFTNFVTILVSPVGALIVAICFFYMTEEDVILSEVNKGSRYKIGPWFVPFGKYVFVIITVLVTILGAIYGGIG